MASSPITSWQIDGETMETATDFIFLVSKITTDGDCSHEIKRHLLLGRKAMTNLDCLLKSRDILPTFKGPFSQNYDFSSSHVWMWVLDHKEGWVPRNWCFQIGAGEDSWESLGQQGDQTSPKGYQLWIFVGRTLLKLKLQYFGHLLWRADSLEKTLMLRKIEGRRRRKAIEDEMTGCHHWVNEQVWADSGR